MWLLETTALHSQALQYMFSHAGSHWLIWGGCMQARVSVSWLSRLMKKKHFFKRTKQICLLQADMQR